MTYYIGQKLYYVPKHGEKKEITITKIGRKYLECDGLYHSKILISDLSSLNPKDNTSYYEGQAYLSKEDYEKELKRQYNADVLYYTIEKERKNLSIEQINKIFEIIGYNN